MEKEYTIIVQVENIKDNGYMIKSMDMVLYNMLMVTNIKDIGKIIKDLDREFMNILMEIYTKANGLLI